MTVRAFLTQHDLAAYADAFEAQGVSIADLADLADDELRSLMGVSSFSDRKRFKAAVTTLSNPTPAPPLSGATRMAPPPTPIPSLSGATRMAPPPTPPPSLSGATRLDSGSILPERRARHTEEGWAQRQGAT